MPANHIPVLAEPGELVIPREIAPDLISALQKALGKVNDDMEKHPAVNGLDFRQFMVGSPEAKIDEETGMQMFFMGSPPSSGPGGPGYDSGDDFTGTKSPGGSYEDYYQAPVSVGLPAPTPTADPFSQPVGGPLVSSDKVPENAEVADLDFSLANAAKLYSDFSPMRGGLQLVSNLIGDLPGVENVIPPDAPPLTGLPEQRDTQPGIPTAPSIVPSIGFTRPGLLSAPENFGFAGLDELQQRSRIATEGLHGSSLFRGDEAQKLFKNLLQRSLIGEGGQLGDTSSLLPVEADYIRQVLGLNFSDVQSLLRGL